MSVPNTVQLPWLYTITVEAARCLADWMHFILFYIGIDTNLSQLGHTGERVGSKYSIHAASFLWIIKITMVDYVT